ncbi:MAG: zf-HC2 domain-containing protein [Gemmatimonadales bacterium]
MSHLDEGTLHALLDGELDTTEVAEIQAHLGSCSACGLRLREVKDFFAEADRLIASVSLGATSVGVAPVPVQIEHAVRPQPVARPEAPARPEASPRPEAPAQAEPPARPRPAAATPAAAAAPREPWNEPPPMLFIPDNESAGDRRRRRLLRAGWAALAVGMVGAGFLGVKLRPSPAAPGTLARSIAAESDAVVSPEEASRADTPTPRAESPAPGRAEAAAAKSKPAATPPAPPAERTADRAEGQKQLAGRAGGAPQPAASTVEDKALDEQTIDSAAETAADPTEADAAAAGDIASVRTRASEALAELDRERRRNQAAAATASLDAERRRRAAAASAPAPASPVPAAAPPTVEQRAQVYLRIGLDEASRQLGGPVHVIEGLSPLFMGLARGTTVAGADATRPVVRVVYQDSQGRLILLDQQRVRTGQPAPNAGSLSWPIGDTAMWLNGEASGDILRTYRTRVR